MAQNSLLADPRLMAAQLQTGQALQNQLSAPYAPAAPEMNPARAQAGGRAAYSWAPDAFDANGNPASGGGLLRQTPNSVVQGYQDAMRGILAGRKALGQRAKETLGGQANYDEALAAAQPTDPNAPHYGVDTLFEHPLDTIGYGIGQAGAGLRSMGGSALLGGALGAGGALLLRQNPLVGARIGATLGGTGQAIADATGQEVVNQQADPAQASQPLLNRNLAAGLSGAAQGMAHYLVPETAVANAVAPVAGRGLLRELTAGAAHGAVMNAGGALTSQTLQSQLSGQNKLDPTQLGDAALFGAAGALPMHVPAAGVAMVANPARHVGGIALDAAKDLGAQVKAGYTGMPLDGDGTQPGQATDLGAVGAAANKTGNLAASAVQGVKDLAAGVRKGYSGSELDQRARSTWDTLNSWGQAQADQFGADGGLQGAAAKATRAGADLLTGAYNYGDAAVRGAVAGAQPLTDELKTQLKPLVDWWNETDMSPTAAQKAVESTVGFVAKTGAAVTRTGVPIVKGLYEGARDSTVGDDLGKASDVVSAWINNAPQQRAPGDVVPGAATWRNADHDIPVTVQGLEPQPGSDGRTYARVVSQDGQTSFVPADEIVQNVDKQQVLQDKAASAMKTVLDPANKNVKVAVRNASLAYDMLSTATGNAYDSAKFQLLKAFAQSRKFIKDAGGALNAAKLFMGGDDEQAPALIRAIKDASASADITDAQRTELSGQLDQLGKQLMSLPSENDVGNPTIAGPETALNSTQGAQGTSVAPQGSDAPLPASVAAGNAGAAGSAAPIVQKTRAQAVDAATEMREQVLRHGDQRAKDAAQGLDPNNPANHERLTALYDHVTDDAPFPGEAQPAASGGAVPDHVLRYSRRQALGGELADRDEALASVVQRYATPKSRAELRADPDMTRRVVEGLHAQYDRGFHNPQEQRAYEAAMYKTFGSRWFKVEQEFARLRGDRTDGVADELAPADERGLSSDDYGTHDHEANLREVNAAPQPEVVNHRQPLRTDHPGYKALVGQMQDPDYADTHSSRLVNAGQYLRSIKNEHNQRQVEAMWMRGKADEIERALSEHGIDKPREAILRDLAKTRDDYDAKWGKDSWWNTHKLLERTPLSDFDPQSGALSDKSWMRLHATGSTRESKNISFDLAESKRSKALNPVEITRLGMRNLSGTYDRRDAATILRGFSEGLGRVLNDPRVRGLTKAGREATWHTDERGRPQLNDDVVVLREKQKDGSYASVTAGELRQRAAEDSRNYEKDRTALRNIGDEHEVKVLGDKVDGKRDVSGTTIGRIKELLERARDYDLDPEQRSAAADMAKELVDNTVVHHGPDGIITHRELQRALRAEEGKGSLLGRSDISAAKVDQHLRTKYNRGDLIDGLKELGRQAYFAGKDAEAGYTSDMSLNRADQIAHTGGLADSRMNGEAERRHDMPIARSVGEDGYGRHDYEADTGLAVGQGGAPAMREPAAKNLQPVREQAQTLARGTVSNFTEWMERASPEERRNAIGELRAQAEAIADEGRPVPPKLKAMLRLYEGLGLGKA